MAKLHRSRLGLIAGLTLITALLFAAVAAATCGGGAASLAVTGGETINLNETKEFTVENTGGSSAEIQTEDLPNPAPVKLEFVGSGCLGNLAAGSSCKRKIKCTAKGTGSWSVTAAGGLSATLTIKCD